jgi:hypothetical protein
MRALLSLALTLLLALAPATGIQAASESGSHGWSRSVLILSNGPGSEYDITGQIPAEVAIKVLRCQRLWCLVDGEGGRGWTDRAAISFGRDPWPLFDPNMSDLSGGSMCFYEGANFTGRYFCADTGDVFQDLALWGWDNKVSSIQVTGTSAAICRDRFFQSYCERIVESQPSIHDYLRKNLSSIRVY